MLKHFIISSGVDVKTTLIGLGGVAGGIGITLTDLEQWLRVGGAFVGLMIGLITLYRLLRNKSHKQKNDE